MPVELDEHIACLNVRQSGRANVAGEACYKYSLDIRILRLRDGRGHKAQRVLYHLFERVAGNFGLPRRLNLLCPCSLPGLFGTLRSIGANYVSGYGHGSAGTMTTFWVYVEKEGLYQAELCYGNGTGSTKTLSLLLDGSLVKQTRLRHAARWNLWTTQPELLTLHAGRNAISYVKTANDNGQVNLDFMLLAPQQ